jgi:spore germination protein GerM
MQAVERAVPASQEPAYAALAAFIGGPNGDERADDFQYPFDRRTRIHGVRVSNGTAAVNLGSEIDRLRGRPYSELVYWALVHTLSEVPGIERVELHREGIPLRELGDPAFAVPTVAGRGEAPAWARPRNEPRTVWPPL